MGLSGAGEGHGSGGMDQEALRGKTLRALGLERDGRFVGARQIYEEICGIQPPFPLAHYLFGCFKLLTGEYDGAWPHFQRRLVDPFFTENPIMNLPGPRWDGADAPTKTLLIHIDQGIGDAVLAARYVSGAAARVGRVVLLVQNGFRGLFEGLGDFDIHELSEPLPPYDMKIDFGSLPAIFAAAPGTIPTAAYIGADATAIDRWRQELGEGFKVGIVWQGNSGFARDRERSIPILALKPLLTLPGTRFVSLQVGPDAARLLGRLPPPIEVVDLAPVLTAPGDGTRNLRAIIANLDLVIGIDSMVVNLAAAMGRPVWVLAPSVPEWRWTTVTGDGDTATFGPSPWYPTARLFRQRRRYDLSAAVRDAALALAEHLRTAGRP